MYEDAYLVVEGHGEVLAASNLVSRLWADLRLPPVVWMNPPIRGLNLARREGVTRACQLVRLKPKPGLLVILRDEDDLCPRDTAPQAARWIAEEQLPFAAGVVLLHREFESLFLPCVHLMAGKPLIDERGVSRPGLVEGTSFNGDPESVRGAKEWLGRHFGSGRRYKPTLDQLPLTRMLDFEVLRSSGLPAFGTLERTLRFLSDHRGTLAVYPPPAA